MIFRRTDTATNNLSIIMTGFGFDSHCSALMFHSLAGVDLGKLQKKTCPGIIIITKFKNLLTLQKKFLPLFFLHLISYIHQLLLQKNCSLV